MMVRTQRLSTWVAERNCWWYMKFENALAHKQEYIEAVRDVLDLPEYSMIGGPDKRVQVDEICIMADGTEIPR